MTTSSTTAVQANRTPRRRRWLPATLRAAHMETRDARSLVLDIAGWEGHVAGQHVDVRLTAHDGYTAQRNYSIASASRHGELELTVQQFTRGEVSPYLVETMEPGDLLEVRGPLGRWFTWTNHETDPVLLIGGGAGIVPLMSMLRERSKGTSTAPFHAIFSVRTPDHLYYANELFELERDVAGVTIDRLHTRSGLPNSPRPAGRITANDLPGATTGGEPLVYVCGPTAFVESASDLLTSSGHSAAAIRTERFGPTGS